MKISWVLFSFFLLSPYFKVLFDSLLLSWFIDWHSQMVWQHLVLKKTILQQFWVWSKFSSAPIWARLAASLWSIYESELSTWLCVCVSLSYWAQQTQSSRNYQAFTIWKPDVCFCYCTYFVSGTEEGYWLGVSADALLLWYVIKRSA